MKIKVLRIIARLNVGGPAIHTTLLTEKLNREKFDSQLVTGVEAENEGNMLELMRAGAVEPIIIPSLGREISPRHDMATLREVKAILQREKPHIVHTHTAKAGFVGRLAAKLTKTPIIVHTFHGNVFKGYFSPAKTKIFIAIEKMLAVYTDRIIVLSEQQKNEILSLGIGTPEKFRIIPLGLDLKPFLEIEKLKGELRRELNIADDIPLVGIVARLVPIKAIDLFISAAKRVLEKEPRTVFLIAGDGELRADLEAQVRELGIENSVRFLGFRSDLDRIYADLNCKVLCSKNEGLPVAVIEALASGCPVVSTDVGSVSNLVEHEKSGLLVPTGDAEKLADAIIRVLTSPEEVQKWRVAGREKVYPHLDISRLVRDIEHLYDELLREKGISG